MKSTISNTPLARIRLAWRIGAALVILLVSAAWWFMLGAPALAERHELADRAEAIELLRSSNDAIHSKLAQVAEEARHWEQAASTTHSRTTAAGGEAAFLQSVNEGADACGLTLRDYRPSSRHVHGEFDCRGLYLSAHGSYEAICRFLDHLRECPRMCRITSFEVTPRDASGESYALTLQVILFSQSKPVASPKG